VARGLLAPGGQGLASCLAHVTANPHHALIWAEKQLALLANAARGQLVAHVAAGVLLPLAAAYPDRKHKCFLLSSSQQPAGVQALAVDSRLAGQWEAQLQGWLSTSDASFDDAGDPTLARCGSDTTVVTFNRRMQAPEVRANHLPRNWL